MPGFSTHVSTGAVLGTGLGLAGYASGLPVTTCAIGAGLCTVGSMLPDVDGDTGVPLRETIPLVAAVVPALLYGSLHAAGWNPEQVALAIGGIYVLIRFGLGEWFKHVTVHRGMWHSIPAALNCGLITLLICSGEDLVPRGFKAAALVAGFLSHLVLDELWCIDWARFRLKRSCGTALKLWMGKRWWPNVLTYGMMALLAVAAFRHPVLRESYAAWREERRARAAEIAAPDTPPEQLFPISGSTLGAPAPSGTPSAEAEPVQR
jgi:membrane-bound metal-dependent hydrolase YbcI (DUF457 family)